MDIFGIGLKLNPSAEDDAIKVGTTFELPMWLAQPIGTGRKRIVSVELPKSYTEAYRDILKADPKAVDLHKFGLYFYELGAYAKQFDNQKDVANILIHTFQMRFRKIMDLAENTGSDQTVQDSLDILERKLYYDSHRARTKLNAWLIESGTPLEAASMVINHKKRKRVDVEDII